MAEDTTTPEATTTATTGTEPDPIDYKAEAEKWKALSRKHEAQAKSNNDAATKLKEREDADKTESEKLTGRAAEAEKRAADAEARALRLEVAAAKGLTPAQAKRLAGATKEELEADADELLATFKPADTAGGSDTDDEPVVTGKPREALRPGTASTGGERETSIDEAMKRINPIT